MALSAHFVADFSSLYKELEKAEVRFKKVALDANEVQESIQSIGKRFSGAKVIEDAAKMAAAIEAIGGASILTEKEARRVNAALSEALEKAAKTGEPVTAEMKKLAAATEGAGKSASFLSSTFASMTAAFSVSNIINSIVGSLKQFASDALQAAGNLVDLRAATGVSLEMLQRWTLVAQQGGIELENLTKASFKLGNQLTEGKSSTRGAVEALGLSFDALRSLKPEQQLDAVLKAAEPLGSTTERNAILTTLFGEKAALALARVIDGYTALADSTKVATDAQIEAIDRATNAYDKLKTTITTGFIQAIGNLYRQATETGLSIDQMTEAQRNHYKVLVRAGGGAELYALQLKDQRDAQEKATKAAEDSALAHNTSTIVQKNYTDVLKQTVAEVQKLDPETRKQIRAARDLGISQEELTDRFGLTAIQLKILADVERTAEESVKKHKAEVAKAEAAQKAFKASIKDLTGAFEPYKQAVEDAGSALHDFPLDSRELAGLYKLNENITKASGGYIDFSGAVNKANKELAEQKKLAIETAGSWDKLSGVAGNLGSAIVQAFQGGGDALKSLGSSLGSGFGQDVGEKLALKVGGKMGDVLGGMMGPLGALAGAKLGEGMAKAVGWIKGLFSDPMKKEIAAANKEIDKLKTAMLEQVGGSIDQLEEKYNALGLSIREAFAGTGKQGLEALKAVQEEFNKRLEESKTRLEDLRGELENLKGDLDGVIRKAYEMGYAFNEQGELVGFNFDKVASVAKEFGVDLAALGPAFQQAQLTAEAQKVIDAFTLLTMSGADAGSVLVGMTDEINKIVNDSLKFGTVIPANMKPWIEELIRAGQLTDANGQKITDISQIKFGDQVKSEYEKITESIQTVLTAMQTLIDQISGLVSAIEQATRDRTMTVRAVYEDPGPPAGFGETRRDGNGGRGADAERAVGSLGATGRWFENFGAGRLVRLHGQESVVRRDQAAAFAADMGGGADVAAEVSALRGDLNDALPRAIARAMRDALQLNGGLG